MDPSDGVCWLLVVTEVGTACAALEDAEVDTPADGVCWPLVDTEVGSTCAALEDGEVDTPAGGVPPSLVDWPGGPCDGLTDGLDEPGAEGVPGVLDA